MLHENRTRAESFGKVAARYDRARPTYPPALFDALLADGALDVLDVGCGTGIAAALMAQRGCSVLGVEIDERMAAVARSKHLEVEVASFEEWERAGRSFDLVTCAQAWHWIDPRTGVVCAAEALRPGGRVGVFWNIGGPPAEVQERLEPIYVRLAPEVQASERDPRPQAVHADFSGGGAFEEPVTSTFAWNAVYDAAGWTALLSTHSHHQVLPPDRLDRLLAVIGDEIDAMGGSFEMTFQTLLVSAVRRP
jgi:SAM-dependent methyltransferase